MTGAIIAFTRGAISLAIATGARMSAPFAVTPCASIVPSGSSTVLILPGIHSRNSIQLIRSSSRVLGAGGSAANAPTGAREANRKQTDENALPAARTLLFALRLDLAIHRSHADPENAGGFLAGTSAVVQRRFDVTAFLLLDEFIERLADRHRGNRLLGFFTGGSSNDLGRQIARQDDFFLTQGAGPLDRVFELANVAGIIVVAKNIDRLRIDFLRLTTRDRG